MNESFHLTDFGDMETVPDEFTTGDLCLGKGDAVVNSLPFEPGVSGSAHNSVVAGLARLHAPEEGLEGKVHPDRDILENLAVNAREFRVKGLPVFEGPVLLFSVGEGFAGGFVERGSFNHQAIVNIPANGQDGEERGFLCSGGKEAIF